MRRPLPLLAALALLAGCAYHADVQRAEGLAAQGDYNGALAAYDTAAHESIKPRDNDIAAREAALKRDTAAKMAQNAQQAGAQQPALAALFLKRAAELDPSQQPAADAALAQLQARSGFAVTIQPRNPEAQPALDQLKKRLAQQSAIHLAVQDMATSASTAPAENAAPPPGTLAIQCYVSEPQINMQTEIKLKGIQYQDGTQKVTNAAYTAQLERIKQTQAAYTAALKQASYDSDTMAVLQVDPPNNLTARQRTYSRAKWDDSDKAAQAVKQQLDAQTQQLKTIPAQVDQPIMKPYTFNEQLHSLHATAELGGGLATAQQPHGQFDQRLEFNDAYEEYPEQKEAKLKAMIPVIPSNDDVLRILQQQAGNALYALIKAARAAEGQRLAESALAAGSSETSRETAAQAVMLYPEALSADQIKQLRGIAGVK